MLALPAGSSMAALAGSAGVLAAIGQLQTFRPSCCRMRTVSLCASPHGRYPRDLCPPLTAVGLIAPCPCAGTIAFVGILGYIISFSLGAGAVTGLMVPEVNPERLRGEMGALC